MATKARPRTHTAPNNQVSDRTDAALTTLVERLSSRRSLHHVNLAVASTDGRHRWAGAAGPERTDGPQARPEAPFFIASITKRFIITLVLQAHERGELDLDVPITAYLPRSVTHRLHMHQGVDRTPQITVRHLASHTSGLPDFFEHRHEGQSLHQQLRAGRDSSWTFDDAIAANRQQRTLFAPQDLSANSQRARYSDTGFLLLIHLLQTVTATPFAERTHRRPPRPDAHLAPCRHARRDGPPHSPTPARQAPAGEHRRHHCIQPRPLQHHRRPPHLRTGAVGRRALCRLAHPAPSDRTAEPAPQCTRAEVRPRHDGVHGQPAHAAAPRTGHPDRSLRGYRHVALHPSSEFT